MEGEKKRNKTSHFRLAPITQPIILRMMSGPAAALDQRRGADFCLEKCEKHRRDEALFGGGSTSTLLWDRVSCVPHRRKACGDYF